MAAHSAAQETNSGVLSNGEILFVVLGNSDNSSFVYVPKFQLILIVLDICALGFGIFRDL